MIEYTNEHDRFLVAYAKMWQDVFDALSKPEKENVHRHEPESRTEVQPGCRAE